MSLTLLCGVDGLQRSEQLTCQGETCRKEDHYSKVWVPRHIGDSQDQHVVPGTEQEHQHQERFVWQWEGEVILLWCWSGNGFQWPPARHQEDTVSSSAFPLYISPTSRTASPAPATPPVRSPVPILKNSVQPPFQVNNQQNQTGQHVQFKTEDNVNNNNNNNNTNNMYDRYQTSQQGTPIPVTVNRNRSLTWINYYNIFLDTNINGRCRGVRLRIYNLSNVWPPVCTTPQQSPRMSAPPSHLDQARTSRPPGEAGASSSSSSRAWGPPCVEAVTHR